MRGASVTPVGHCQAQRGEGTYPWSHSQLGLACSTVLLLCVLSLPFKIKEAGGGGGSETHHVSINKG